MKRVNIIGLCTLIVLSLGLSACSSGKKSSTKQETTTTTTTLPPTPEQDSELIDSVLPQVSEFSGFREVSRATFSDNSQQEKVDPELCPGVPSKVGKILSGGEAKFIKDAPAGDPSNYEQAEFRISSNLNSKIASDLVEKEIVNVKECQDHRYTISNSTDTWDYKITGDLKIKGIDKATSGKIVLYYKLGEDERPPGMPLGEWQSMDKNLPINTHYSIIASKGRFMVRVVMKDLEQAKKRATDILMALDAKKV